ncbi:hypothetical protein IW262DRAFT_1498337 [Armillaria fumosa]|nr:hypothetical protein IW262DRAFT_1498337 [Armillaria fumosa]
MVLVISKLQHPLHCHCQPEASSLDGCANQLRGPNQLWQRRRESDAATSERLFGIAELVVRPSGGYGGPSIVVVDPNGLTGDIWLYMLSEVRAVFRFVTRVFIWSFGAIARIDRVVVFSEMKSLPLRNTPPVEAASGPDGLLYTTPLVSGYWKTISESSGRLKLPPDIVETPHASGTLCLATFKFSYPAWYSANNPPLLSDPQFGLSFDYLPTDGFGTDDSTEMMEYGKPESHVYDFHSFDDAAWGFFIPPHSNRSSVEKPVPGSREGFDNRSTPESSSPTSVCFPII